MWKTLVRQFLMVAVLVPAPPALGQDPDLMARADSLSILAADHFEWGRFRQAEVSLREALAIDRELFGEDALQTVHSTNDLAWILWYGGRNREADSLFQVSEDRYLVQLDVEPAKTLRTPEVIFENALPVPRRMRMSRSTATQHPDLGRSRGLNNLGWLFGRTGAFTEAWTLLEESLRLEREQGADSVELAAAIHNQLVLGWFDYTYEGTWYERADEVMPLVEGQNSDQAVSLLVAHSNMLMRAVDNDRYATLAREAALTHFGDSYWRLARTEHFLALSRWLGAGASDWTIEHQKVAYDLAVESFGMEHLEAIHQLSTLAYFRILQGHWSEADSLVSIGLERVERIVGPDHLERGRLLGFQASLEFQLGRLERSEEALGRAAAFFKQSDPLKSARYRGMQAQSVGMQGRLAEAEIIARQGVARLDSYYATLNRDVPDSLNAQIYLSPEVYLSLAGVLARQGQFDEAREILDVLTAAASAIWGEGSWAAEESMALLARIFLDQGALDQALELSTLVRDLRRRRFEVDHPDLAKSHAQLGAVYLQQGRFEQADSSFARALSVLESSVGPNHPLVGSTLIDQVRSHWEGGQASSSDLDLLDRALKILEDTGGMPASRVEALALRARLLRKDGDTRGAVDDMEEALDILNEMRPQVGGGEETRAGFFERYGGYYDDMISWLVEDEEVESAFKYSEMGRARVMLDQLAAGQVDIRSSIPEEIRAELERRESRAQTRSAEFEHRITLLRSRTDMSDQERVSELAILQDSLRRAHRDFQAVYDEIKNASPLWRSQITTGGAPVSVRTLQRTIIGDGALFLGYQLGERTSHLFVIGGDRGDIKAVPLVVPADAADVLGIGAGSLTVDLVARVLSPAEGEGVLPDLMTRSRVAGSRQGPGSGQRLHALWKVLIPEGIRDRVMSATEVVLIPDGALNSLPFEALVVTPGDSPATTRYWLDEAPPIRYAPSATVLHNIAGKATTRIAGDAPSLLTVADPIYDLSELAAEPDPSAPSRGTQPIEGTSLVDLNRNAYTRAGGTLVRLPGTRIESDEILKVIGGGSDAETLALRDTEATEANIRAAVENRQFIHLATHGLVGGPRGALFASLALTPPSEGQPDAGNDGYLQLHEIYDLPLSETELAVLSACDTNVGAAVQGEGVFALSRGFLAAGARRVVASQWAVDDASTAALMGKFFEAIARDQADVDGIRYAADLAEAKKAVRSDPRWSDPYYWAPFVLAGTN